MRDWKTIWHYADELYSDLVDEETFFTRKPLLAHYTTAVVLEQMLKNNEIWFGNPLFMNDVEEVRFGINEGTRAFLDSEAIRGAFSSPDDAQSFETELLAAHRNFDEKHAFDTYIVCFCEHREGDDDGLLSMWRGYGDSGRGVAIVFDGRQLADTPQSPLIMAKVSYASADERRAWFVWCAEQFAEIIRRNGISGKEVTAAAWALFARLRLFSLFSKHQGFSEEQEWRLAYMPERDANGDLKPFLSYHNGPRGIEPKLKVPFVPSPAFGGQEVPLERLVHSIILGPSASSPLAHMSAVRMLESLQRGGLANRIVASGIPYRASS